MIAAFETARVMYHTNTTLPSIYKDRKVLIIANGTDPVPQDPMGYVHPVDIVTVNIQGVSGDVTPFRQHHMPLLVTWAALSEMT